jgi:ABC-type tungstate transport system substrate-binding protein
MEPVARVANLDERAQNVQLRLGIGLVTVGLFLSVLLARLGVRGAVNLALAPLFFMGAYGLGSAMIRTCGITAFLGRRRVEEGTEPVADRTELAALRRKGIAVLATSVVVAVSAAASLAFAR